MRTGARGQERADESSEERKESITRHSTGGAVGIESNWQVLAADFQIKVLATDSERQTGWELQRATPSDGSARGREVGHAD